MSAAQKLPRAVFFEAIDEWQTSTTKVEEGASRREPAELLDLQSTRV